MLIFIWTWCHHHLVAQGRLSTWWREVNRTEAQHLHSSHEIMTLCVHSVPSLKSCSDSWTPSISFIIIFVSHTHTQTTASDPDKFPNQPITIMNSTTTYKRYARCTWGLQRPTTYWAIRHFYQEFTNWLSTYQTCLPFYSSATCNIYPKDTNSAGCFIMSERNPADIALTETQKTGFVIQETISCHHCWCQC